MASTGSIRALHLVKTSIGATWALRQMNELSKAGVEVHVALPSGPLVREYERYGIQTHIGQYDLPITRPTSWPRLFTKFRSIVGQIRPDIIHSHFVGTTLTMRLALGHKNKIPRIFQVPGPLHLEYPFLRMAEIATARSLDYWIGSCKWTMLRYIRSGVPSNRVFLSYYGIDFSKIKNIKPGMLRTELGLSHSAKIIGMVAYLYPPKRYLGHRRGIKGHEDLIDAIDLVREDYPEVVGVFVGGAWGNALEYERKVRAYGRAKLGQRAVFLGNREDVANLYADFDVAVHPSHSENVGGAVESLSLAVPTIATNVGGFRDVVIPGKTGWLVNPNRPDELARTIVMVLNDLNIAKCLACNGQEHVIQLFDVRRTGPEIYDIYRSILAE